MRASSFWVSGLVLALAGVPVACGGDDDSGLGTGGSAGSGGSDASAGAGGSTGGTGATGGSGGVAGSSATGGSGGAGGSAGGSGGSAGSAGSAGDDGGAGASGSGGIAGSGGAAGAGGISGSGGVAGKGGTGGTAGTAGKGGSAGKGGTGGTDAGAQTCNDIQAAYAKMLAEAKTCSPLIAVQQCTLTVDDELACPCPTFVNPSNTQAVQGLAALETQWKTQGCQIGVICPAVLCPQPSAAVCTAAGTCKDVLTTSQ